MNNCFQSANNLGQHQAAFGQPLNVAYDASHAFRVAQENAYQHQLRMMGR